MQTVGDAVGTHRVVTHPQSWLIADFEYLKNQQQELVTENLGKSGISEQENQRVVLTYWILVEENGVS